MLYSLRNKLIAALLFASLAAALAVGGTAHWLLMQDFDAAAREQSFNNFYTDLQAYLGEYGTWENAERSEPFPEFVRRHRRFGGVSPGGGLRDDFGPPLPEAGPPDMEDRPPPPEAGTELPGGTSPELHHGIRFRFLLANPQGRVLHPNGAYHEGQQLGDDVLRLARPVSVNGKVEVLAIPIGTPQLSAQDRAYLELMRKALLRGMLVAGAVSILLGFLLGGRFGARIKELTTAIQSMRTDGELLQQVPVRTRDEMGELATAFNRMSSELAQAHADLTRSSEQIRRQSEQLKELSIRDPLTQLFNRRHFDEQAALLYQQAIRHSRAFSVMVGDLDHFKSINDNFSHATGDEVLRRVAELMRANTRSSDVVARYGGEEFVIAFVESTAQQAAVRCEELRRAIEQYPWHEIAPKLQVTMSMGLCDDTAQGNVEKMLAVADTRLYQAKHGGRNRVVAA